MPTKTTKKTSAKTVAAKKPVVRKTKKSATTSKKAVMVEPAMTDRYPCGCKYGCPCGGKCTPGHACECGPQCRNYRGGSRFWRFVRKLIVFAIIFALGFAAARMCCMGPRHHGPRIHFTNGCLDVSTVKCPKLMQALPAMDINQDGCITRDEFRAVRRQMRAEIREIQVQEVEENIPQQPAENAEPVAE